MKEYLKIAEDEESLLHFYYKSIESFDIIFIKSWQNLGDFINKNNKPVSGRYAHIAFQIKNAVDSFFGHYFTLKNGLCNSSISNLRYCFETLLKNYFYLTLPVGEKDLIKYQKIYPSEIRKKLYTLPALKGYGKLYEMLSTKSHAGIISSSPSFNCSSEMYKDSLETGINFLCGYFIFILDCFNQFILVEDREQIKEFLKEFSKIFNNKFPTFIPDKEDVNLLLKFKNVDLILPDNVEKFKRDKDEYLKNS